MLLSVNVVTCVTSISNDIEEGGGGGTRRWRWVLGVDINGTNLEEEEEEMGITILKEIIFLGYKICNTNGVSIKALI